MSYAAASAAMRRSSVNPPHQLMSGCQMLAAVMLQELAESVSGVLVFARHDAS